MKLVNGALFESGNLILIDGHGLAYRAFYAMPELENSKRDKIGAVYGFLNMLVRIFEEFSPAFAAVSFDKELPAERLSIYKDYKAKRQKMPESLAGQFQYIEELLSILGIPVVVTKDHEADDCIGAVAEDAQKKGLDVLIVSGDKDFLQLVSPGIKVVFPQKGFARFTVYDEKAVHDEFGFEPVFISDYKALAGDSSDNIPGAAGIGAVTAKKLVSAYGNIENILANVGELPAKTRKLVEDSRDSILLSKKLAKIKTALPLYFEESSMKVKEIDNDRLFAFLRKMEFRSFLKKYFPGRSDGSEEAPVNKASADSFCCHVNSDDLCVHYSDFSPASFSLYASDGYSLNLSSDRQRNAGILSDFCEHIKKYRLCGFDLKVLFRKLIAHGIALPENFFDIALASYMLEPSDLSQDFLRVYERVTGNFIDSENLSSEKKAAMTAQCVPLLEKSLQKNGMQDVFCSQEQPLLPVLARMEHYGIYCDRQELFTLSESFNQKLDTLEEQIYTIAGEKFNINSPKQLGYILFEKLQLPGGKKPSTNHETLLSLMPYSPLIPLLLDYKELKKLLSTYAEKLPELINPETGRIHTTFTSRKTATGRLASSEPNLQNIPTRTAWGKQIRAAFKPKEAGKIFLSADYSQIELRLMAHFADDEKMIKSFEQGVDIHSITAAEIFGAELSAVTENMRRKAKEINFGILYGMSAHGLSQRISVDMKEAKSYIERYFNRFPSVESFINRVIAEAYDNGFVTTIMGRKRWVPDLKSRNVNLQKAAQRVAVNTVIQGSAADIIKLAMIRTDDFMTREGLEAKMLLQIHDELLFELPEHELADLVMLVRKSMEKIMDLRVPLNINIEKGKNWSEMELIED